MPEGRMLSKSIATSEQVASVSLLADYLFTRMIPHLDCEGRMAGSPRTVRGIVCPLREDVTSEAIAGALRELSGVGLIVWYEVDGQPYVEFPKFKHHQRGARFDREGASRIPLSAGAPAVTRDYSGSTPGVLPLSEVKGSEVKQSKGKGSKESPRAEGAVTLGATWLTPYLDAWKARFGGDMPTGPAAQALSPLHKKHGGDETLRRWTIYLAATDASYATPSRFASTFGTWGQPPTALNGVKPTAEEQTADSMRRIFQRAGTP